MLVLLGGCQPAKRRLAVYPVRGTLKYAGKPAERAEVSLYPLVPFPINEARQIIPYGVVQADGSFAISTYASDDGAPAGDYAVTIVWPKITIEGGEENRGPDRLGGLFKNPQKPLTKFTVVEGDNLIPAIDLPGR